MSADRRVCEPYAMTWSDAARPSMAGRVCVYECVCLSRTWPGETFCNAHRTQPGGPIHAPSSCCLRSRRGRRARLDNQSEAPGVAFTQFGCFAKAWVMGQAVDGSAVGHPDGLRGVRLAERFDDFHGPFQACDVADFFPGVGFRAREGRTRAVLGQFRPGAPVQAADLFPAADVFPAGPRATCQRYDCRDDTERYREPARRHSSGFVTGACARGGALG